MSWSRAGERLDLIMIPKVGTAADVYAVDMLVTQCEAAMGRKKRIGFEMIIETALGMQNVDEIAAASRRNESLHFGVADYAASTRARTTNIGGANPDYAVLTDKDLPATAPAIGATCGITPSPAWWWPPAPMGLRPVDGPFGDFSDPDGYQGRGQPGRRARLRGQMGNSSLPGCPGQ